MYLPRVPTQPPSREDQPSLRAHLVSHTHWDREWYQPASVFRQRLVPLVDALLDAPDGSFLLDGQCVVLTDYLAMRPERESLLRQRLAEGTLEVGPWYVLADNLIPSGEAILRNLEAGDRIAQRFGARSPTVAYCPDSFGHPAMLPAIAAGYGFPVAIVWRGLGGASHPAVDTLWWQAPDGSRVLAYHLPPDGYEFGSALPHDDAGAAVRWQHMATQWQSRATTNVALLPNGADHHARQGQRPDAVRTLVGAAARDGATLIDSSLQNFARELREHASAMTLPTVFGELRDSYGYTWTLQGTFGTRAAQKRTNAVLERALLRDVEPWLALAWLHASPAAFTVSHDARMTMAQLPSLLHHAWESLLRTHPHDTLCGCSTDDVAQAMHTQQRDVAAQAVGLRDAALALALDHDPAIAREQAVVAKPLVLVRNRVPRARAGLCELTVVDTLGDVRVGPGSASVESSSASASNSRSTIGATRAGETLRFGSLMLQSGVVREAFVRRESPQHYPDNDRVRLHRMLAWVPQVPAHGVALFRQSDATDETVIKPTHLVCISRSDNTVTLDNGLVQINAGRDGIDLIVGNRTLRNVLSLQSTADLGDSYTTSLRGAPSSLRLVRVAEGARGPLRASVRLRWELFDAKSERRSARRTVVDTELVLDADSHVLQCWVRGRNRSRDHRLRIVWHNDVADGVVHADAAFGPVRRDPIDATEASRLVEQVPMTVPLHRWITTSNDARGITLLSDGLAEAEVQHDRVAVTLLRAIGELSRADLPERPGHAGWPVATPASQSLGAFRARFGVLLHDAWSATTLLQVEDAADGMLLPLVGETLRDYSPDWATVALRGVMLEGDGLRASAITLSRDGSALVLRATNVTDADVRGAWRMPHDGPWEVTPCRLDETPTEPTIVTGAYIALHATARALVTVRVRRAAAAHRQ